MSDIFDLDAFIAETTLEPFRFTFGGETYELPHSMDMRAAAALAAGRLDDAFRMMFTPTQWDRIQASPAVLDSHSLLKLIEAYAAHSGMTAGK